MGIQKRSYYTKGGIMDISLDNLCAVCGRREANPKVSVPMFEGQIVNPETAKDWAGQPACDSCHEEYCRLERQWEQSEERPVVAPQPIEIRSKKGTQVIRVTRFAAGVTVTVIGRGEKRSISVFGECVEQLAWALMRMGSGNERQVSYE